MHRELLIWFFNNNSLDRDTSPPVAAFEHFRIKILSNDIDFQDMIENVIKEKLPGREDEIRKERIEIEAADTCDQIVRFMRRGADLMNQDFLVKKALEFEDEIIPVIISMLKTSLNDLFIELSVRVLAICGKDICQELTSVYNNVRNPYAQSLILVALGFKADEKSIPWLIKQFDELRSLYPDESYHYGAYYALYEMDSRFYSDSKKFDSSSVQPE